MPNMTLMAPKDENELSRMLVTALAHNGPIAIRYPRGSGTGIPMDKVPTPIKIGKAKVLHQGEDVLIIAIGSSVSEAETAVASLEEQGVHATLINARFVKPLDLELIIPHARRIKKIITVEEHVLDGGFGSAILEMLMDNDVTDVVLKRIGIQNRFVEHGSQDILRKNYEIDSLSIVKMAMTLYDRQID
jgi:1-deoxy-D-xylulose-5-phosphate synthase